MSMETQRWAQHVDALIPESGDPAICDVLIVGSGYGGSFAAHELAGAGDVWVVERGREYALGEFPEDIGALPGHVRYLRRSKPGAIGKPDALFDLRSFEDVSVLVANGLGGGSLINAGVALKPQADVVCAPHWPGELAGARKGELYQTMDEVIAMLQAAPLTGAASLGKFRALAVLAEKSGSEPAEPVPVTIASEARTALSGLHQAGCTRCGNCFTGCNVGAKNTLVTHVVPDAARRGARFFTGGTALWVEPITGHPHSTSTDRPVRWRVSFARTLNANGRPDQVADFHIDAHAVVLAAGTLGSTELLLRSPRVPHSTRLGHRFSTNGDLIAMGWAMEPKIDGVSAPRPDSAVPSTNIGPTIVGSARASLVVNGRNVGALLQDGAIPSALGQAAVALGSALSLAHRYTRDELPGAYPPGSDPLAVPASIGEHAFLLLGIGNDPATGVVSLIPDDQPKRKSRIAGKLQIEWLDHDNPRIAYQQAFDELLVNAAVAGGFQGGDYLANPGWRPFPPDFNAVSGEPPRKTVTVHPLGGCPMADQGATGVVDWKGAVFSGEGARVHEGLYVMDGAMVPSALGVNPFVTIAALSLLAARQLRIALQRPSEKALLTPARPLPQEQPAAEPLAFQAAAPIHVTFEERLQGAATGVVPQWLEQLALASSASRPRFGVEREWVAKVKLSMDLHAWLADPSAALPASLELYENSFTQEMSVQEQVTTAKPLLVGSGTVTLLALDAPVDAKEMRRRTREALRTYLSRRSTRDLQSAASGTSPGAALKAFLRAGRNHALQRTLSYQFSLASTLAGQPPVQARGEKRLAYARDQKNVWEALTQLDLHLVPDGGHDDPARLALKVDLVDMVRNARLQVSEAPNTPAVVLGLASFASLWVRAIVMTHFWTFRGSNSESTITLPAAQHGPLRPHGLLEPAIAPVRIALPVPAGSVGVGMIDLELTRYDPARDSGRGHVLLIHGLAHGGTVFTTDTVGSHNMATAFLSAGYTVWVLDHRLSNRLPYRLQNHTIDDIAQHDIPAAVRHVYCSTGGKIKVFAHCVGAGAFAMAALSGKLQDKGASMIETATIHAVHPWLVASASNQLSAALAALYKDLLEEDDSVDPLPAVKPRLFDQVLDRFAASIPWTARELALHERHKYHVYGGCAVCSRMTVFYGREWVHANLSETTHERIAALVGPAGIEVFRQLYFMLLRGRLTDRRGFNAYLTQSQVEQHFTFPVLFCHGRENKVFNPRGAVQSWHRLSRLRAFTGQARAVEVFIADGYGHMDFLFGKNAHREVFPRLLDFMESPTTFDGGWRWRDNDPPVPPSLKDWELSDFDFRTAKAPLTGPMVQLERSAAGKRQVVLWFEQRQHATSEADGPALFDDRDPLKALAWSVGRLKLPDLGNSPADATIAGAGVFWVGVLEEEFDGQFRGLGSLRLELRSQDPDIKMVDALVGLSDAAVGPSQPLLGAAARHHAGNAAVAGEPRMPYGDQLQPLLAWSDFPWWRRWLSEPVGLPVSWLASSCRWPGLPFERDAPDAMASGMYEHLTHADLPVDALVLLGDQIYADATADVADTAEPEERGAQRYRDAWGGACSRRLLQALPTYMVVDDHEFRDNWDGSTDPVLDKDFVNGFKAAIAYQSRWSAPEGQRPHLSATTMRGFWREFAIGDVPAFAADTRSERRGKPPADWTLADLMHDEQMAAIERWLVAHKDQPKVLCTGSVFGFVEENLLRDPALCRSSDGWFGYPRSWKRLAAFIALEQIRNLIFLSGDYHLSAIADLEIEAVGAGAPAHATSVVCSGWNATVPFANQRARDFRCGERVRAPLSGPEVDLWTTSEVLSTAFRQFSKLTVVPAPGGWELQVRVYAEGDWGTPVRVVSRRL